MKVVLLWIFWEVVQNETIDRCEQSGEKKNIYYDIREDNTGKKDGEGFDYYLCQFIPDIYITHEDMKTFQTVHNTRSEDRVSNNSIGRFNVGYMTSVTILSDIQDNDTRDKVNVEWISFKERIIKANFFHTDIDWLTLDFKKTYSKKDNKQNIIDVTSGKR